MNDNKAPLWVWMLLAFAMLPLILWGFDQNPRHRRQVFHPERNERPEAPRKMDRDGNLEPAKRD